MLPFLSGGTLGGLNEAALELRFGSPEHGWLHVELTGPGGVVAFDASDTPGDSVSMLADAACDIVNGYPARDVTWFLEPQEHLWVFRSAGDLIEIWASSDSSPETCIARDQPAHVGWIVWRALRRLEADAAWQQSAERVWSHPFPHRSVASLHERLQRLTA
jgi:hypothetical protein